MIFSTSLASPRHRSYNPPMNISITTTPIFRQKLPALLLFAYENEQPEGPAPLKKLLATVSRNEFSGKHQQLLLLHTAGKLPAPRLLLAGLGKRSDFTPETLRRAMGAATKKLLQCGIRRAAIQLRSPDDLAPVTEAAALAAYKFTRFKPNDDTEPTLQSLVLHLPPKSDLKSARQQLAATEIITAAANYTRDIANEPGNLLTPEQLATHARSLAKQLNLKCTILTEPQLRRLRFGGLLAVGSGSAHPPRLIALQYRGAPAHTRPIAIVGKAITFDSGGLSIKPAEKMDEMKFDKSGGVAVLGILKAVAQLKLPLNVLGVIAAAENMPGASSYRPGDILTSYRGPDKRGVTVEVLNTDAEGRIVLGDAIAYARQHNPQAIIDLATLTGACVVALGTFAAGLMGNDETLQQKIRAAADRTGERVWPLPLWDDYKEKIKSDIADIKNSAGREAGAITAAAFLARYVGNTPWAHLDIAGTAWTTEERPYYTKGATGYGVRLLLELLQNWS
jgi:leucyl aminopeptidase